MLFNVERQTMRSVYELLVALLCLCLAPAVLFACSGSDDAVPISNTSEATSTDPQSEMMPSPENIVVSSDYSDFPTVEEMVANSTAIALIELEEPLLEIPINRSAGDDDVATVQMNVAQRARVTRVISGDLEERIIVIGAIVNTDNPLVQAGRVGFEGDYRTELLEQGESYVAFLQPVPGFDPTMFGLPADEGPFYGLAGSTTGLVQVGSGTSSAAARGTGESLADLPLSSPHEHGLEMQLPGTLDELEREIGEANANMR